MKTSKSRMQQEGPGNFVTCPNCGKISQKTITMRGEVFCPKCKTVYFACVQGGITLVAKSERMRQEGFARNVQIVAEEVVNYGNPQPAWNEREVPEE